MRPQRDFSHEVRPHSHRGVRCLLLGAGVLFAGLGIAGVILPLLPGMPFLILAAACFARANERFYNWLLNHRWVGPPLHAWRNHRRIPRWVKPRAIAAVLIAFGISSWLALEDPLARAGWFTVGLLVSALIAKMPSYDERLAPDHVARTLASSDDDTATESAP